VNKPDLLRQIIATLSSELENLQRGARESFAAATDPDSKAENKYDTRTLEASYVARGQAQRVAELQQALHHFQALPVQPLPPGSAITTGSLVTLAGAEGKSHYFIGPGAGGTEVVHLGTEVLIITPSSPLGQRLMSRRQGERITLLNGVSATIETAT